MSDPRDDLAALIAETYDAHGEGSWDSAVSAANGIIAAGYVKPKPPTVTPDHDIDAISSHLCAACGRGIEWDDDTESWRH